MVDVNTDASEKAAAKMKGLDEGAPMINTNKKPQKDVNTFINNQLKFVGGNTSIPPDQMKCNILKAKAEEQYRKGKYEQQTLHDNWGTTILRSGRELPCN